MPLTIITKRNNLATSKMKAPYLFTSKQAGKKSLSDLLDEAGSANTTITRTDLAGCVSVLIETTEKLLSEGYRVEFPFVDLYLKAYGTALDIKTPFTPKNLNSGHSFSLHALVHKKERKVVIRDVSWIRMMHNAPASMPHIDILDYNSTDNIIVLRGRNLDFDSTEASDGVTITRMEGGNQIRPCRYVVIRNSVIIATLPVLTAGTCYLHIHSHGNTVSRLFDTGTVRETGLQR
jgi:hypothetical protein